MDFSTLTAGRGLSVGRSRQVLAATVFAAFALVLAWFVLVQSPAEAQIDFRQFVCPILLAIRNSFANSPFFGFVAPVIDQLLLAFGCGVS